MSGRDLVEQQHLIVPKKYKWTENCHLIRVRELGTSCPK